MASDALLRLTVLYAPAPRQVEEILLELPAPCTLMQAVQLSGLPERFTELNQPDILFGIWGRKSTADQVLRDQDRIEIYRPLRVDPKVARRERFVKQGSRGAGLFIKLRIQANKT